MPSSRLPIWQHNGSSIRLLRALVSEDNVESIFFLAKLFRQKAKSMHGMDAVLNPTFSASKLVFGADADLILADTLIELKTINDLPVWKFRQMVTQTLSYYLLDINDAYQVQSIGIYFLRKAWFWKSPIWYYFFPPEDVFRHLENGTRPRAEVVRRAVLVKRSALQGLLQARYQRWMDQRAAIVAN
jgi:hypothetical protein